MSCSRLFVRYELPSSIKNKHLTVPSKQLKRAQSPRCSTARPMGVSQFPEHSTGRLFESRAIKHEHVGISYPGTSLHVLVQDLVTAGPPGTGYCHDGIPQDCILRDRATAVLLGTGSSHDGTQHRIYSKRHRGLYNFVPI